MKLVKFNVESGFKNIPDEKYHAECARLNDLADNDYDKFAQQLFSQRSKYPYVEAHKDQEIAVPDWFYEAYKDQEVSVSVSYDNFKDRAGNIRPFEMYEALNQRLPLAGETITKIKRFTLIEDLGDKKQNKKVG